MKQVKKAVLFFGICLASLLGIVGGIYARRGAHVAVATKESTFNRVAKDKYPYAFVMFYEENRALKKDKLFRERNKQLQKIFKQAADKDFYKDAELAFVKVNVAGKRTQVIAQEYSITQFPTFILLQNGKQVTSQFKQPVQLTGYQTKQQLRAFIKKHLGKQMDKLVEEKRKERRRIARERRMYGGPYMHFGYGYSPFWGYGWPHYGGYGFRHRYGWPYRYGYGYPHYGIGFGFYL